LISKLIDGVSAVLIVGVIITILILTPIIAMVFAVFLGIATIFLVIQDHRARKK